MHSQEKCIWVNMNLSLGPLWTQDIMDLGSSYVSPIYKAADSVDGRSLAKF